MPRRPRDHAAHDPQERRRIDPVRGVMDPATGVWRGDGALALALNAVPAPWLRHLIAR